MSSYTRNLRHSQNERPGAVKGCGVARALSKLGYCSRSQAWELVLAGRVRVKGRPCRDPEMRIDPERDEVAVDGKQVTAARRRYVMLNKPRGLVTTRSDEHGRDTVYSRLQIPGGGWLSPVGRLDKASEGLLLFTNDTAWADQILSPESHVEKRYHVQINRQADPQLLTRLVTGVQTDHDTFLSVKEAHLLRSGARNCWLELTIDEGKNKQIRRLLEACGIEVLRLIRVAIGSLALGELPKGQFRELNPQEVRSLTQKATRF